LTQIWVETTQHFLECSHDLHNARSGWVVAKQLLRCSEWLVGCC